jgi:flagellar basal-body rod protein FlgG
MNLALYAAASGMDAQQLNLSNISNNIANVSTTGFKKQNIEFEDMLYQNLSGNNSDNGNGVYVPSGVSLGNGTKVVATTKIFTQGQLTQTNNPTDVAIQGNGFFEVQLQDGTKAYTRDGALQISSTGQWVTSNGLPLEEGFQQVSPNYTNIAISTNGYVTVTNPTGQQTFRIQLATFPNPSGLQSIGQNLYQETQASGSAELGNPSENGYGGLQQNYLESSNVDVVNEMVNMIVAQRAYEINAKSVQTADEMLQRVASLKQ